MHESFQPVCLNYKVLRKQWVQWMDVASSSITELLTAQVRFEVTSSWLLVVAFLILSRLLTMTAYMYRQFTHWAHETLGSGVRIVIPLCVVSAICRTFLEETGHYVGFIRDAA